MGMATNNMPSRPQYQLAGLDAMGIEMPARANEKHVSFNPLQTFFLLTIIQVLSTNAAILREEMIGYIDAILERQDRADVLKKMESFQMEGVSRKVFRELTEHYKKLDQQTQEKIVKLTQGSDLMKKRVDQQESQVKKLQ